MPHVLPTLLTAAGAIFLPVAAAAPSAAEQAFLGGDYAKARELSRDDAPGDARSMEIQIRALLAVGDYAEAAKLAARNVNRFPRDAAVLLATHDAQMAVGLEAPARAALSLAVRTPPGDYEPGQETPSGAAARATALSILGGDPKLVLDRILNAVIKQSPNSREPYLALAEIALDKHDYALAAKTLQKAAKIYPEDADIEFGLARAFANTPASAAHLEAALASNPRHVPALLLLADVQIDADDYEAAQKTLDAALAVNPASPEAWARRSLLARLRTNPTEAAEARQKALAVWPKNPEVDYLIGTGFARKYRFSESIDALKSAVAMSPSHLPSHLELGTNLLRFGNEEGGWQHIEMVQAADPYNVAAFNLVTLRETTRRMETIRKVGARVRMTPGDRLVYGNQAADLAEEACRTFSQKYGVAMPFDVLVDVLPTEQDFAVRTFSLPGSEGFLGVCFGPLITTCSPRGRLERANWQAVLWHEMAHSITLTGTRHRIPRWLSEGISVHEENLMKRGWGRGMNSGYRAAILSGDVPSIREMDAAFRGPGIDLAYFRAGMIVAYIEQRFGTAGMRRILERLRKDEPIDTALEAVVGPLDRFEADFDRYSREQAEVYGAKLDWTPLTDGDLAILRSKTGRLFLVPPQRFFAAMLRAQDLAKEGDWASVVAQLEPVVALEPDNRETESPYALLAEAHRHLNDTAAEQRCLEKQLALDAASLAAARRLLEIAETRSNPSEIITASRNVLSIDPFNSDALVALGRSMLKTGSALDAVAAYEAALAEKPLNAPRLRLELARGLAGRDRPRARHQLLLALEDNPRLLPALDLLQRIQPDPPKTP